MIILRLVLIFLKNETKIIINFFYRIFIFLRDVNLYKYFYSIFSNELNLDIFYNKYLNKYLLTNYKLTKKIKIKNDKSIFVEGFITHPEYQIYNILITKILSEIKNQNIKALLRKGDIQSTKIFQSYRIKNFIYINDGNLISRFIAFLKAFFILKNVDNFKTLLKIKYDGIDIGKCLYEEYLRFNKNPHIYSIEPIYFLHLMKLLIYNEQFKKIYNNQKNTFLVQSETQYLPFRLSRQRAMLNDMEIVSRSGRKNIMIKVYRNIKEIHEGRAKIPPELFNKIQKKIKKKVRNKYFKSHIEKKIKLNIGLDEYQKNIISKDNKKYFNSRKEVNEFFNFEDKPIVVILAHEYTDGNLSQSWNLYENDMLWLVDTIEKIKKIKDVNWIIKSHPSEKVFNANVSTEEIFHQKIRSINNIKLFPNEYEISNFFKYTSTVITSHGTASYEYPLFSIPAIICGEANCSGNGFTLEPKTKKQYHELLKNISKIKRLDNNQVKRCWVFNYIFKYILLNEVPFMTDKTTIKSSYNKSHLWKSYLLQLNKNKIHFNLENLKKSIDLNLKNKDKFVINHRKI